MKSQIEGDFSQILTFSPFWRSGVPGDPKTGDFGKVGSWDPPFYINPSRRGPVPVPAGVCGILTPEGSGGV